MSLAWSTLPRPQILPQPLGGTSWRCHPLGVERGELDTQPGVWSSLCLSFPQVLLEGGSGQGKAHVSWSLNNFRVSSHLPEQ